MAILREHIPFVREIFSLDGMLAEPFLMFGYQDIQGVNLPQDFRYKDVKELLLARGLRRVTSLDCFDPRADLRHDMNLPIPEGECERYGVVFDLGSLEHVFDTRQCIENCLRMVRVGGLYFLHTPVNGYFAHGLHVFNPDGLLDALTQNQFEILYKKYTTRSGRAVVNPNVGGDVLIWVVARKRGSIDKMVVPQQATWASCYTTPGKTSLVRRLARSVRRRILGLRRAPKSMSD